MESSGVGILCTPDEKLDHYLSAVTSQHAIESKFVNGMIDALNAEVALGTVTNVTEAVQWLGYTYLFVRMKRNPLVYGMPHSEPVEDPQLGNKRLVLVTSAARQLAKADMLKFDESTGEFTITDLGRIAAKYYIRHSSIEVFNKEFKPKMSEADVLAVLSMSTEFDQIQSRENEQQELKLLMDEVIPCQVKGGTDTNYGKVNILLQSYISQAHIEDFALVSDTAYAAQNGGRIIRALLEIAISRKWASVSTILMAMSKAVEKRMWPYEHPLKQLGLRREVIYNIEQWIDDLPVSELAEKPADEIGRLIHLNELHGAAVLRAAKHFPSVNINYTLRPLTRDLLQINITIKRAFEWSQKVHGSLEPFWIWVEDQNGVEILQWMYLAFRPTTDVLRQEFIVPVRGSSPPSHVTIRFISDRWIGAEDEIVAPFSGLVMPEASLRRTRMLDVPFLAFKVLSSPHLESRYTARYTTFNGMQTQCFWTLYNTYRNVIVAAPTGSGKTLLAHLAIWRTCVKDRFKKPLALVISHNKSNAHDFASSLRPFMSDMFDVDPNFVPEHLFRRTLKPTVRITTSSCLASYMLFPRSSVASDLSLLICDDLESLDEKYEVGVTLLLHAIQNRSVRVVGLSSPLYDTSELAKWLHVPDEGVFSFQPSDREQSIITSTQSFTIPHSAALLKAMAKPAYAALRATPAGERAIVFVPAQSLCRSVAADLITQCGVEMQTRGFLGEDVDESRISIAAAGLEDQSLADSLIHGIGIYHGGLARPDRKLILGLYAEGIVRVLVTSRDCCWSVPVRGSTVVVMGTQYWRLAGTEGDRQLMNYSNREVSRMQSRAVQHGKIGRFHLFCQAEDRDTFTRFLDQGLPLESCLLESEEWAEWLKSRVRDGIVASKQDAMDVLSFTFLVLRMEKNPGYYGIEVGGRDEALSRHLDNVWP
ncbi:hypothetical protein FRC02_005840 [Tulasnella sp. 418]|nr:hypothetical protein FRC02_005840 [Tulasnella sp. 418]